MFIEYPKALYLGGVGSSIEHLPHVVVQDAEEEAAKNAQGWFEIGKAPASAEPEIRDEEPAKRKPGRPRKTEAE